MTLPKINSNKANMLINEWSNLLNVILIIAINGTKFQTHLKSMVTYLNRINVVYNVLFKMLFGKRADYEMETNKIDTSFYDDDAAAEERANQLKAPPDYHNILVNLIRRPSLSENEFASIWILMKDKTHRARSRLNTKTETIRVPFWCTDEFIKSFGDVDDTHGDGKRKYFMNDFVECSQLKETMSSFNRSTNTSNCLHGIVTELKMVAKTALAGKPSVSTNDSCADNGDNNVCFQCPLVKCRKLLCLTTPRFINEMKKDNLIIPSSFVLSTSGYKTLKEEINLFRFTGDKEPIQKVKKLISRHSNYREMKRHVYCSSYGSGGKRRGHGVGRDQLIIPNLYRCTKNDIKKKAAIRREQKKKNMMLDFSSVMDKPTPSPPTPNREEYIPKPTKEYTFRSPTNMIKQCNIQKKLSYE